MKIRAEVKWRIRKNWNEDCILKKNINGLELKENTIRIPVLLVLKEIIFTTKRRFLQADLAEYYLYWQ